MSKGEATREAIVDHALSRSSVVGLEGLTIGGLADALDMSKSGLFAHFRSKEALQLDVVEAAARRFVNMVIRPTVQAPRGIARVRRLFDHWLAWEKAFPGGCFFIQASVELDSRPGPVRDRVVELQRDWLAWLAECCRRAIATGDFHERADPEQLAYTIYSLMLGYHVSARLLGDPAAEERLRMAFEALLRLAQRPEAQ